VLDAEHFSRAGVNLKGHKGGGAKETADLFEHCRRCFVPPLPQTPTMGSARFQHAVRGILAANFCPREGLSKNNFILPTKYPAFARYGAAGAKNANPESFRSRDRTSFVSFACFVGIKSVSAVVVWPIRDLRSLPAVAGNPRPATPEALAKAGLQKISKLSV
jgi:hypothetical protein